MNKTALFLIPLPNPHARLRLICLAYAGGSSATYFPWLKFLHPDVELVVCQLPGRGSRLFEAPYDQMEPLIHDLSNAIRPLCNIPVILFGHSMGSKVGYELCLAMEEKNLPLPVHFIVSAAAAPFHPRHKTPIHDLPEAEFIAALSKLNGTSPQILNDPELIELFLPALRADFKIVETYINLDRTVVPTGLTVMGGIMDETVLASELADWNKLFMRTEKIRWFKGGHFFINHETVEILQVLNEIIDLALYNNIQESCLD